MLKLSSKGRYAVRIMIFLAVREEDTPARKQDIADSEQISADYVEQILIRLRAGGLVISHRGARGGFTISRDAKLISVMDVLVATEGPLQLAPCCEHACDRSICCAAQQVWDEAAASLRDVFGRTMIADLADKARKTKSGVPLGYSI
ncbi:MAG TPA: AsnC family transcriptional regulator [Verrucomicrobia bacterium]|nr:AsnC family transcriptional regulator [Verrucomicrobiota bacterium]